MKTKEKWGNKKWNEDKPNQNNNNNNSNKETYIIKEIEEKQIKINNKTKQQRNPREAQTIITQTLGKGLTRQLKNKYIMYKLTLLLDNVDISETHS